MIPMWVGVREYVGDSDLAETKKNHILKIAAHILIFMRQIKVYSRIGYSREQPFSFKHFHVDILRARYCNTLDHGC